MNLSFLKGWLTASNGMMEVWQMGEISECLAELWRGSGGVLAGKNSMNGCLPGFWRVEDLMNGCLVGVWRADLDG